MASVIMFAEMVAEGWVVEPAVRKFTLTSVTGEANGLVLMMTTMNNQALAHADVR